MVDKFEELLKNPAYLEHCRLETMGHHFDILSSIKKRYLLEDILDDLGCDVEMFETWRLESIVDWLCEFAYIEGIFLREESSTFNILDLEKILGLPSRRGEDECEDDGEICDLFYNGDEKED